MKHRRGLGLQNRNLALVRACSLARTTLGLDRLVVFVGSQNPPAPAGIGLSQYPGGDVAYRFFIKERTTLDLTPQQIHELGVREVERINGEMNQVRNSLGFKGTKAEFDQFLKTDPRFFAKTPDEVGQRLTADMHRIESHIPQ